MRRGDVWWADLPAPAGRRPVLLLSRNEAYLVRQLVTVAPITTKIRNIPVEVRLGPTDGMPRACVINLDSVVTVAKGHLSQQVTALTPAKQRAVNAALRFALGLD